MEFISSKTSDLKKSGIFISGTDTDIGKTVVSSLLVSSLNTHGICTGYFKPLQTGEESDTGRVSELSGIPEQRFAQPAYHFPQPLAGNRAARAAGKQIQLDFIVEHWRQLDERAWVVEGAGECSTRSPDEKRFVN